MFFAIIICVALLRYFKLKPNVLYSFIKTFVKIKKSCFVPREAKQNKNKNVPK